MVIKIRKPDYTSVTFTAHQVFLTRTDHSFPINILKLCNTLYKTKLSTYEEFAEEIGKSVSFVAKKIGKNNDAFTLNRGEEFIIVYNDDIIDNVVGRIRFSIAHEIGHILLNHFNGNDLLLTRGGLTEKKYSILEMEADKFAQELLLPTFLINTGSSVKVISTQFDVSKQVAEITLKNRKKNLWLKPTLPYQALFKTKKNPINFLKTINTFCIEPRDSNNYNSKIQRLLLKPNYYFCPHCKNLEKTFKSQMFYCVVCGSDNLEIIPEKKYFLFHELKEKNIMTYSRLEIDQDSRLKQCPIGQNDHVSHNFCSVCGIPVINKCSKYRFEEVAYDEYDWVLDTDDSFECDIKLEGSDRFCPVCGCASTFHKNNLLQSWDFTEIDTKKDNTAF